MISDIIGRRESYSKESLDAATAAIARGRESVRCSSHNAAARSQPAIGGAKQPVNLFQCALTEMNLLQGELNISPLIQSKSQHLLLLSSHQTLCPLLLLLQHQTLCL